MTTPRLITEVEWYSVKDVLPPYKTWVYPNHFYQKAMLIRESDGWWWKRFGQFIAPMRPTDLWAFIDDGDE